MSIVLIQHFALTDCPKGLKVKQCLDTIEFEVTGSDEETRAIVRELVDALEEWINR